MSPHECHMSPYESHMSPDEVLELLRGAPLELEICCAARLRGCAFGANCGGDGLEAVLAGCVSSRAILMVHCWCTDGRGVSSEDFDISFVLNVAAQLRDCFCMEDRLGSSGPPEIDQFGKKCR
ncbi:unnamed protein product [Symbiodinium sp. CCMP2592]|nr:unnamed protein product [Symbiodinium sp. CCMP2592]